jgi:predicted transcriptional regulator
LAAQAISEYLKIQEWQLKEIKKGISEAQQGQLVSHKDIVAYWEKRRADPVDEGR